MEHQRRRPRGSRKSQPQASPGQARTWSRDGLVRRSAARMASWSRGRPRSSGRSQAARKPEPSAGTARSRRRAAALSITRATASKDPAADESVSTSYRSARNSRAVSRRRAASVGLTEACSISRKTLGVGQQPDVPAPDDERLVRREPFAPGGPSAGPLGTGVQEIQYRVRADRPGQDDALHQLEMGRQRGHRISAARSSWTASAPGC